MITYIPYALQEDQLVHISDVESGLKCNCTCPGCGSKLIARKGSKKVHHFAHYNVENCKGGLESALHLAAKAIFEKYTIVQIPRLVRLDKEYTKKSITLIEDQKLSFDEVQLEKQYDEIKPDITLKVKGQPLFIEVANTHFVDIEKQRKVEKIGISMIEIDISSLNDGFSQEELETILVHSTNKKKWIFNSKENHLWERKLPHLRDEKKENDERSRMHSKSRIDTALRVLNNTKAEISDIEHEKEAATSMGFEIIDARETNYDLICPKKIYEESQNYDNNKVLSRLKNGEKWDGIIHLENHPQMNKSVIINGSYLEVKSSEFDLAQYEKSEIERQEKTLKQLRKIKKKSIIDFNECKTCKYFHSTLGNSTTVICKFRKEILQKD